MRKGIYSLGSGRINWELETADLVRLPLRTVLGIDNLIPMDYNKFSLQSTPGGCPWLVQLSFKSFHFISPGA